MITLATVKAILPNWALDGVRRARRRYRRTAWEHWVKSHPEARVTETTMIEQLRALGVNSGRDLILHSSLSRIGLVEGGPEAVVRAIRAVIGPDATLLMPVYPMKGTMYEHMRDPTPFDLLRDPSCMGKITEIFRSQLGVERSAHPTHSVAAQGPRSRDYVEEHHHSRSPCGPGSPFRRLSQNHGQILCLGTGVGKVTSHHTVEDIVDDFPVEVYLPTIMTKTVRFADGHTEEVEVLVHAPALAPKRVDAYHPLTEEIRIAMLDCGILREGRVGHATAHLFGAAELDEFHIARLRKGKTIYAI